jgi:hypothetical protein
VLYGVQKIARLAKQDARTLTHVTELSLELRAHDPESP